MKKLSGFDLGIIIAFVVVTLLGGGAWYYFSGELQTAVADVAAANSDFKKYSSGQDYLPTVANQKILQGNIALLKTQLDPLVQNKLLPKENKITLIEKKDAVEWKHDLDDRVRALNTAAKHHAVTVPANFYYGFSRYLTTNPAEEKTVVLGRQLLAIEQLATILIEAPVKSIQSIRRTFEEDPASSGSGTNLEADRLTGNAVEVAGGTYTVYPYEVNFDTSPESLRKIVNDLVKSPYIFIIRNITIQNSKPTSPQVGDLDKLAGSPSSPSIIDSSPGEVASTNATSTKGPQYLFGGESVHVKARIDLIQWNGMPADTTNATAPASGGPRNRAPAPAGN